ncbi:hypothetical protein BOTBODRAFT_32398 [Botryobasidium botryosum FD-172 SS1]|uniref:Ubiquitin-like domain-containing protein n=1 Tax=Botryobasidium botryosum (strain FD-172 SS1) TaxID=930990 RepID=A0A067MSS5_BOTB1|nr:hypothetical protein BOTBODRAFT_32398 [Botryobasidium botryosum FD-172 SS1]
MTSLNVLLPSHSHSLTLSLPSQATIADLKHAIFDQCTGRPRPHGQRVIWKGRVVSDTEVVGEIWQPSDQLHTIHLAVHPSAWTSEPPSSAPTARASSSTSPFNSVPSSFQSTVGAPSYGNLLASPFAPSPPSQLSSQQLPQQYLTHLHSNALRVIAGNAPLPWTNTVSLSVARSITQDAITMAGLPWSNWFGIDLETLYYPSEGVKYEVEVVDNLPYLKLATPTVEPSEFQIYALNVLTLTFPMLSKLALLSAHTANPSHPMLPYLPRALFPANVNADANPNANLQQQQQRPRVRVRHIRVALRIPGRLIMPLIMTVFRATVLLSFFPPSREPLWAAGLALWLAYEFYELLNQAIGAAAAAQEQGQGQGQGQGQAQGQVQEGQGQQQQPQQAAQRQGGGARLPSSHTHLRNLAGHIIDRVASVHLASEAHALNINFQPPDADPSNPQQQQQQQQQQQPAARPPLPYSPEPGFTTRAALFTGLLFATFYPAVWERRQKALREREVQVRKVYGVQANRAEGAERLPVGGAGEGAGEGEGNGAEVLLGEGDRRRAELTGWRREYVERVLSGDVDEFTEL